MTDNRGGVETYIMSMFRAMDRTRIMFDYVTDFSTIAFRDEVEALGAKIYYIPAKSKHPIGQIQAFMRILNEHPEYDEVYFNILNAGSFYSMIAPILKKRRITAHSHNGSDDKMRLHKMFRPLLNRYSTRKLACSELAGRYMFGNEAFDNGKVKLIKNAIDVNAFTFDREMRKMKRMELGAGDHFIVSHVGRIVHQKNPMGIIDIFEQIY